MRVDLPDSWMGVLAPEFDQPYWAELASFVDEERRGAEIVRKQHDVNEVAPQIWGMIEELLARARPQDGRSPR